MTKRRNPQAVAAYSRHAGAHDPGTKRPDVDELEEQLEEYEDEREEEQPERVSDPSGGFTSESA